MTGVSRGLQYIRQLTLTLGMTAILVTSPVQSSQTKLPEEFGTPPLSFEESESPITQQDDYYDFMWRSFIALNWPNVPIVVKDEWIVSGFRGQPDLSKSISDTFGAPGSLPFSVWETYKEPFETFILPETPQIPEWNTPRPAPGGGLDMNAPRPHFRFPIGQAEYTTDTNQPYFFPNPTGPLFDQHGGLVRYEVAINQAFYTYVRHFRYNDGTVQFRAVSEYLKGVRNDTAFQRPPFGNPDEFSGYLKDLPPFAKQGMIDVKAAWRPLTSKDDTSRYLTRNITFKDGGPPQLMGLVALHILRYTPNNYKPGGPDGSFVASTFEQVDNVDITFKPIPGLSPSFNSGAKPNQQQTEFGFEGSIPPPNDNPATKIVDVYRAVDTPDAVKAINARYQAMLAPSVFQYYRLIGTQNMHLGAVNFFPEELRVSNGHEGPTTGVYTNTNNLINTALESYSQRNFSCILCHVRARPWGGARSGKRDRPLQDPDLPAAISPAAPAVRGGNTGFGHAEAFVGGWQISAHSDRCRLSAARPR